MKLKNLCVQSTSTLFIALLHCKISCFETNNIDSHDDTGEENTHLYLIDEGVLVDEKVTKDTKHEMLIMDVPAHQNHVETRVVYDETPGAVSTKSKYFKYFLQYANEDTF